MRDTEKENLRVGRDGGRAKKFPSHQMLIYHHDALLSPPLYFRAVLIIRQCC